MAYLRTRCPRCGEPKQYDEEYEGTKARCPACGLRYVLEGGTAPSQWHLIVGPLLIVGFIVLLLGILAVTYVLGDLGIPVS